MTAHRRAVVRKSPSWLSEFRTIARAQLIRQTYSRRYRCVLSCVRWGILLLIVQVFLGRTASAHEGTGRAGFKEPTPEVEAESELYVGRQGYVHGGLGVLIPLSDKQKIGIVGHFVREETGGAIFPSLGAEFVQDLGNGFDLEAYSFGYFPVEKQHAWAAGLRAARRFAFNDHLTIAPFIGPAYARVQAIDEATDSPVTIDHLMVLGGVAVHAERFEFSVFASQSFFSRDSVGLETHVDLEEMTHFAAYENNDGFARNSAGAEASYAATEWLKFTGRYALIRYEDETRHSMSFTPAIKVGSHLEVFGGVQFLRGGATKDDLLIGGASFGF